MPIKHSKRIYLILRICFILSVGVWAIKIADKYYFKNIIDAVFLFNTNKVKLNKMVDFIENEYIYDVNTDSLVEVLIKDFFKGLDPHTTYIPKDQVKPLDDIMHGQFLGIGLRYTVFNDTMTVIEALDFSPAKNKDLMPGDRIMHINGQNTFGENIKNNDISKMITNRNLDKVELDVYRKEIDSAFQVTLIKKNIPLKSIQAAYIIQDSIGYIKINAFAETTHQEFITVYQELKKNLNTLIIDLRNNPGGYLSSAVELADEFLEKGKTIVSVKYKNGEREVLFSKSDASVLQTPIYLIINKYSASASEVLAGALQDNDLGTIVGVTSFGKGLVQRDIVLPDKSHFRMTIAEYFTPTGRSIQKPFKSHSKKEVEGNKKIFFTPKGKKLHDGGGIEPDISIEDNPNYDSQIEYLANSNLISNFVFRYLDREGRNHISNIDKQDFIKNYTISRSVLSQFHHYLYRNNVKYNVFRHQTKIKHYIKAFIALQIFDYDTHIRILNAQDLFVTTTIHHIKK